MRKLSVLIFFVLLMTSVFSSIYTLNLQGGSSINIDGDRNISNIPPGAYQEDITFFFRAGFTELKTSFNSGIDEWNILCGNKYSDDATVVFYDNTTPHRNELSFDYLISQIGKAQKFIYISMYDINSQIVADALLDAKLRGLDIRIAVNTDRRNKYTEAILPDNGIKIIYDNSEQYINNKFIIIDGYCLMIGSAELNNDSIYKNTGSQLFIYNNELVQNYMDLFKAQYEEANYNPLFDENIKYPNVKGNFGSYKPYFTHDETVKSKIIYLIKNSQKTIYVMTDILSDKDITNELLKASVRGIKIKIIVEESLIKSQYSNFSLLKNSKILFSTDKNPNKFRHLIMLFDEKTFYNGSHYFSDDPSDKNNESSMIIENQKITKDYIKEFERLWSNYRLN